MDNKSANLDEPKNQMPYQIDLKVCKERVLEISPDSFMCKV